MTTGFDKSYNERLFEVSKLRRAYHIARFEWFSELDGKNLIDTTSMLELGCFDGRLLDYCKIKPKKYVGVDGNWEHGLDLAKERFDGDPTVKLVESETPDTLGSFDDKSFSSVVALETLEHVEPADVGQYLDEFLRVVNGHIIVSVPNEKGVVFLLKFLVKMIAFKGNEKYRFSEVINATLGRMDKVERHDHKGFDFEELLLEISQRFDVISVTGLPFQFFPPQLNLTIGIVARPK